MRTLFILLISATSAQAGMVYNPQVAGETCALKPIEGTNAFQRVDPTCGNVRASTNLTYIRDEEGEIIDVEKSMDNGG